MTVTREEIVWGYRMLLGREPESEAVIAEKLPTPDREALRQIMIGSPEFRSGGTGEATPVGRFVEVARNDIDIAATPKQAAAMLDNIRREWRHFGDTDPHWSVLTNEVFRADRIAETVDAFYATGPDFIATALNPLGRAGLRQDRFGRVLDFGCGVGRLTLALAPLAREVVGVDISPAHVALAEARAKDVRIRNARFRAIDDVAGLDALSRFDLIVSFIVLQHNPPPVIAVLLAKLLRALAPGGVAILQIPTYMPGRHFRTADYLANAQPAMEMNALPQHDIFRIVQEAGCRPLEVREDDFLKGGFGVSHTFAILRPKA